MTHDDEDPPARFDVLPPLLAEVLALDQIAEVDLHVGNAEYEVAFEIMCALLRGAGTAISESAFEQLTTLGRRLQIDDSLWRDLLRQLPN